MKTNISHFDSLVAYYYPAVYALAVKLTEDPREAVSLTRAAFSSAQEQLSRLRDKTAIANVLLSAVLHAGLAAS